MHATEGLKALGLRQQAADLYKLWIAYNDQDKFVHYAYFNHAVALRELGDLPGSINALRACVLIEPSFGAAHVNLGRAFEDAGQIPTAVDIWRAYLEATSTITPERAAHRLMTLQHLGRVYENSELLQESETILRQAIELRPDRTEAGQHWIALRQRQCKWPVLVPSEHVTQRQLIEAMSPMALAVYADDPMFQLAKAYRYNKAFVGRPEEAPFTCEPRPKSGGRGRLRIGYVSSDLRAHAVGFALSEVLELHDKSRFETFGYYCGEPKDDCPVQIRIRAALDGWRDISGLTDRQAAEAILRDEIDILVDVNGYTKHARTKIFSWRPAPVIVNWCGYPGTMGSPYHQYCITDARIAPPGSERYFSERVLHIPCNQPIDRKRPIDPPPTRAQAGLPEGAFVYACFNGMQKLTRTVFTRWMAILRETPGSVLWLLTGTPDTNKRLQDAAAAVGVAPERILFAPKAGNSAHLARIALADLFLDTAPYGAHSTAADSLTVGLPILTLPGRGFAARFCASVVAAAGLEELICASPEDYVRRAIEFGRNPQSLAVIREKLARHRDASVLRDIPALVRGLEGCFEQMQIEREAGLTPTPDLTNLDLYYDIGAEFDLEAVDLLDDAAYERLYREKLDMLHRHQPIPHDRRFWRADS
nr:glycosyl transferase [Rhodoblastus acidophilus]